MKAKIIGKFDGVGIPIRVKLLHGSGIPEGIGGMEHSHDFAELVLFHGGRGVHRVDGHDYPVVAGDVFAVHGDQTHAIVQRENLQHVEVTYNSRRVRLPTDQLRKLPGYHALFTLEPARRRRGRFRGHLRLSPTRLAEAMRLIHSMHQEYEARPVGYEAFLLGRLVELMVFLSREYSRSSTGEGRALLRVGEVIGLLEREYARPWRLAELCAIAHMSKSNLMVAFREATGQTPVNYLIRVRLRQAMYLLQSTARKVTEIAFEVGFSDSNYFARKFRQIVGLSPSAYRRSP